MSTFDDVIANDTEARAKLGEQNTYKRALAAYGSTLQKIKAIEELNELGAALSKALLMPDVETSDAVMSEIADCEIMLAQLKLIYDRNIIGMHKASKLARLREMLDKVGALDVNIEDEVAK